jgi:hypothetical protein
MLSTGLLNVRLCLFPIFCLGDKHYLLTYLLTY